MLKNKIEKYMELDIVKWIPKHTDVQQLGTKALDVDCQDLNSISTTCWLCNLGKLLKFSVNILILIKRQQKKFAIMSQTCNF